LGKTVKEKNAATKEKENDKEKYWREKNKDV